VTFCNLIEAADWKGKATPEEEEEKKRKGDRR
jgi:hypothetical protein